MKDGESKWIKTACIRDVLGLNLGLNTTLGLRFFKGFLISPSKMLRE